MNKHTKKMYAVITAIVLLSSIISGCVGKAVPEDVPVPSGYIYPTPSSDAPDLQSPDISEPVTAAPETTETPATSSPPYNHPTIPDDQLIPYDGIVEHLFYHPTVAYTELAFDGDSKEAGIDEYMVTVDEYNKMLTSIYERGYILVNMNDVWSEYTDSNGVKRMKRNTLMIPEGKKPLILSFDDVNYYDYMLKNGFTHKLIIGDDGEIWSYGLDPQGREVITQDLDAITILDKFVKEHPDFSLGGVKGCIALTGYEGILGYRTQTDRDDPTQSYEEFRQSEIERVKPIIKRLKETGWYFASHSWGHIGLATASFARVKDDADRWLAEVGSLVGDTKLFIYPYGSRLDGDDVSKTGEAFKYYHSLGFRVFASVGIESYSKIKSDISAVICDRMHSDGGTLRRERDRYMKFYDAAEVFDYSRPDYGKKW